MLTSRRDNLERNVIKTIGCSVRSKVLFRSETVPQIAFRVPTCLGADAQAADYFDLTSPENPATASRLKAQPMTDWRK